MLTASPPCQCDVAKAILLDGPQGGLNMEYPKDSCLNCSSIQTLLDNLDNPSKLAADSCKCEIAKDRLLDDYARECVDCEFIKDIADNHQCKCHDLGCAPKGRNRCYLPYPEFNTNEESYSYPTHAGYDHELSDLKYRSNNGPVVNYGPDGGNSYGYEEPMCSKDIVHDYYTMAYPPKPPAAAVQCQCEKTYKQEYHDYQKRYNAVNGELATIQKAYGECKNQQQYYDAPNGAASVGVMLAMASAIATAGIFA